MAKPIAGQEDATDTKNGKRRERRNRDSNVIDEAIGVMSEKGYAATSIQEVADRVGVLKGSLYHYFSSKEELLFRILEQSHQQTSEIRDAVTEQNLPPREHLLEHVRRVSQWFLENRDRANIFFTEIRHLSGDRLTEATQWGRTFETDVSHLVVAGQEAGTIRSDLDQRLISRFIIGAVNNIRSWPSRPTSTVQFSNDELLAALILLISDSLGPADS